MLNPFPALLAYQFVIITFLRIVLAFLFLKLAYENLFQNHPRAVEFYRLAKFPYPSYFASALGIIELVGGLLLLVGAFVQYTSIVFSIITFGLLILKDREHPYLKNDFTFYILFFALTFAMIFFGAGAFAFDIPL
ncbi:MAG TPA: DoxX family membrane protein [Candidatus Paceibacterota bacterium]|nr:DoxX family membrane protein [Candidatus Paceibacterota bacterium]